MIDIWRERDGAAWISLRFFLFYLFSFFFCFFQMSGREQRSLSLLFNNRDDHILGPGPSCEAHVQYVNNSHQS